MQKESSNIYINKFTPNIYVKGHFKAILMPKFQTDIFNNIHPRPNLTLRKE